MILQFSQSLGTAANPKAEDVFEPAPAQLKASYLCAKLKVELGPNSNNATALLTHSKLRTAALHPSHHHSITGRPSPNPDILRHFAADLGVCTAYRAYGKSGRLLELSVQNVVNELWVASLCPAAPLFVTQVHNVIATPGGLLEYKQDLPPTPPLVQLRWAGSVMAPGTLKRLSHCRGGHSMRITTLIGTQVWFTWPLTTSNYCRLVEMFKVANQNAWQEINWALDQLDGLQVLVMEGTAPLTLDPGTIFAVLSTNLSIHLSVDFLCTDHLQTHFSAMDKELVMVEDLQQFEHLGVVDLMKVALTSLVNVPGSTSSSARALLDRIKILHKDSLSCELVYICCLEE